MDKGKHDAIQEWQRGVGETTASENACFLDGFDAGRQAREAECEGLRELVRQAAAIMQSCDLESNYVVDDRSNGRSRIIKGEMNEFLAKAESALSGKREGKHGA